MKPLRIKTRRLTLRPLKTADLIDVHELLILPETNRYNTLGIPTDIIETAGILKNLIKAGKGGEGYFFAVELGLDKNFVGLAALKLNKPKYRSAEIWYKLHPAVWGNGYATEAVEAIIQFGFEPLGLHRIEGGCAADNIASAKVLEKAGMTREGRKRAALPLKTGWSDCFEYAMLHSDKRKNG